MAPHGDEACERRADRCMH